MKKITENIVLVPQTIEPTMFSSNWFILNELVQMKDMKETNMLSIPQQVCQFETSHFLLQAFPTQIIITLSTENTDDARKVVKKLVLDFFNKVKDLTKFPAAGINLHFDSEAVNTSQISKALFYNEENPFAQEFKSEDAKFGFYASKNTKSSRLRFEVRPVLTIKNEELMQFNFNFSRTIKDNDINQISLFVNEWEDYLIAAQKIIEKMKGVTVEKK